MKVGRVIVAVMLVPAAALGQGSPDTRSKWEIEVHGGGAVASTPSGGTTTATPAGTPFTSSGGLPSRAVSSWYFGDGAALLNQVNTILPAGARITPLDPVLGAPLAQRSSGGTFGVRATRHLTRRISAELSIDYRLGRLEISDEARAAIEASRSSFESAFTGLLRTGPFSGTNVVSTATFSGGGGRQIVTTGAVNVGLGSFRGLVPYVTAGAGVTAQRENAPEVLLAGSYRFSAFNIAPVEETDTVTLRASSSETLFTGVVGGGVRYVLSPRWALRVDVRDHLTRNSAATLVTATPAITAPPGNRFFFISSASNPSLQFSNFPNVRSTLSGGPINGMQTFEGSGIEHNVSITTGVSWRF